MAHFNPPKRVVLSVSITDQCILVAPIEPRLRMSTSIISDKRRCTFCQAQTFRWVQINYKYVNLNIPTFVCPNTSQNPHRYTVSVCIFSANSTGPIPNMERKPVDGPNITRIHACRSTSHGMTGSGHKDGEEVELQVVSSGSKMAGANSSSL